MGLFPPSPPLPTSYPMIPTALRVVSVDHRRIVRSSIGHDPLSVGILSRSKLMPQPFSILEIVSTVNDSPRVVSVDPANLPLHSNCQNRSL
mmetsp:Transcript_11711/g.14346  ORF Transcript_11711/g.14346 Transcript_11711/m.14346 type:complete len:91 (-) Transcript_11711:326-598(-)